jgi:glycosyltransferase involved in cell wall biosynthesis
MKRNGRAWKPDGRQMNVLHTIAGLHESSGGPSRTMRALCEELSRLDVSVNVVTQRSRGLGGSSQVPDRNLVATAYADCYYLPRLRIVYSPTFRSLVRRICTEERIEILHDHGLWLPTNHAAIGVARAEKIPLVVSPRGMLEPWAFAHRAWKKKCAWALYQKRDLAVARAFCATSTAEARSIREWGFRQPVVVVPNGVAVPRPRRRECAPREWWTALFLSRIHPVKGLLSLVEAWKATRPRHWRVTVAGPDEGGHQRAVKEAVSAASLERVFEFIGPVSDDAKTNLFNRADVLILPTMSESFGIVVAEALAHGLPVITTTRAPWAGLVEHGCGWWVRPEVGELAAAILEATALSDKERDSMGVRGRLWMEQEFAWPSVAKRMLSVYEWILHGGKTPECVIEG